MKKSNSLKRFQLTIVLIFVIIVNANANWNKEMNLNSDLSSREMITQNSDKMDSLPEGVSEEWLNSLRDEKGNRINSYNNTNTSREITEDPEGDAIQRKVFTGPAVSSSFGRSVSNAGDVNGDGYDDIIAGAPGYSSSTGRVYIYFGGLNMNTVADVVLNGESNNNNFGYSVSGAGDVNGDGYSDVIIGAYGNTASTGKAYIYYGGTAMNNTADVIMAGENTSNFFGYSVSSAGDVNGDGYADVIVGAYNFNSLRGRVYVFLGGALMNNIADMYMTGDANNLRFGYSVSTAGDMNGDGYSDFIIGAYGYLTNRGRAYVFFGSSALDSTADITMTGEASSNYFGISVSTAGDVNGDGYADAIVGADGYLSDKGRAYVYYGGNSPDNIADFVMTGETAGSFFGTSVSTAGDVNGDGYSDVIIGASNINSQTGKIYAYFGGTVPDTTADFKVDGEASSNYFGISVSTAGDVNGDGYSDVIAGGHGNNSFTGKVYLYDYFMKGTIVQDLVLIGENVSGYLYFGVSVSSAGDVNGDGYSDVIVGAKEYSNRTGRAYIYFGGPGMDNTADVTMTGETSPNSFGSSVSSAGDVNGDGYSDVIVGAYEYSTYRGRAYVYFGGVSMNNTADVLLTGDTTYQFFGNSVSSAGDVNGDGYSDVIVGANGYSSNRGRANIYLGGAAMDNVADVSLFGQVTGDEFGRSVSAAGDMNGDGYSDVIAGASGAGKAYIYFGGSPMNSTSDVVMTGESSYPYFGTKVSDAGDVNGDGYSDVIVATYHPYAGNTRVYIFHGGANVNNVPDLYMSGSNSFGRSVSSAGDVNADGYSDIIIGLSNTSNVGLANVYFGGAVMDSTEDISMYGDTLSAGFGGAVSAAGDINGDGYSDIIVGASTNNPKGRAYIFTGSAISAKPILNFVKDIPNDQGGYVNLKWARSSFDVNGNDLVTNYSVLRSFPPISGNFSWQEVANVNAQKFSFYTFVDHTPFDSGSNNSGTMFYRIKANTNIPSQYWLSGIISGRSIDNISPLMVTPFTAAASGPNVRLVWNRSKAPDLLNYILYRSLNPTVNPYSETPFSTLTDSTYLDTSPLSGQYYYFIIAQDIHGNYSPVSVTQRPAITLDLTMFIEGFYNAGSNSQVSDTVIVQLRNTSSPFQIIDETNAVVSTSGNCVLNFSNAPDGNYYLALKHRNSIETWSAVGIALSSVSPAAFDFTSVQTQAYGNNQIQIDSAPVRYGIFSGDVNQDGTIDLSDGSLIDNDAFNFESGYIPSDVNGDGVTDLADAVFADNNGFNFVSKITP